MKIHEQKIRNTYMNNKSKNHEEEPPRTWISLTQEQQRRLEATAAKVGGSRRRFDEFSLFDDVFLLWVCWIFIVWWCFSSLGFNSMIFFFSGLLKNFCFKGLRICFKEIDPQRVDFKHKNRVSKTQFTITISIILDLNC